MNKELLIKIIIALTFIIAILCALASPFAAVGAMATILCIVAYLTLQEIDNAS